MDLTALLFTTWLRPKTRRLLVLTDVSYEYVKETLTPEGVPCGMEIVNYVVLTPVGAHDRKKDSVAIDGKLFIESVDNGQLVQIIAPNSIDDLSNQIIKHF
jgi:hypothetical protein